MDIECKADKMMELFCHTSALTLTFARRVRGWPPVEYLFLFFWLFPLPWPFPFSFAFTMQKVEVIIKEGAGPWGCDCAIPLEGESDVGGRNRCKNETETCQLRPVRPRML